MIKKLFILLSINLIKIETIEQIEELNNTSLNLENGQTFHNFKLEFRKNYSDENLENYRLKVFGENYKKIYLHNQNESLFKLKINKLGDSTLEEIKKTRHGLKLPLYFESSIKNKKSKHLSRKKRSLFSQIDWRDNGYVSSVKDQGICGSCWAFSTTGSLEGQWAKKYKQKLDLSQENLLDCVYQTNGCEGGWMEDAFDYIIKNQGMNIECQYPYEGIYSSCSYIKAPASNITNYVSSLMDHSKMEQVVSSQGPVSVVLDASSFEFYFYEKGVFNSSSCSNKFADSNHAVVIVGFNNDNNPPYWIVKNSWGTWWGESGYIKIEKGKNICGIENYATYPLL